MKLKTRIYISILSVGIFLIAFLMDWFNKEAPTKVALVSFFIAVLILASLLRKTERR